MASACDCEGARREAVGGRRVGGYLRSRVPHAQYAESMLRCIYHNVACLIMAVQELGIEPKYWTHNPAELPLFGSMHA